MAIPDNHAPSLDYTPTTLPAGTKPASRECRKWYSTISAPKPSVVDKQTINGLHSSTFCPPTLAQPRGANPACNAAHELSIRKMDILRPEISAARTNRPVMSAVAAIKRAENTYANTTLRCARPPTRETDAVNSLRTKRISASESD